MQDIVNSVFGLFRSILRFKWIALLCMCVLSFLGWAVVFQMDERYNVSARVFVDNNRVFESSLDGTNVKQDIDEKVNFLSRALLNRPNLERLASMSDLTAGATTDLEKEKLLDRLAKDVRLKVTHRNNSIYKVTYKNSDLQLAKRMVQSLITIFRENVIGNERIEIQVTQKVLDQKNLFFQVIDPPFVSYRPSGPGKEILSAGVFVFAIGAGLTIALLLHQLSPVFYGTSTVEKRTSRPVLGSVGKRLSWPAIIVKSVNWILLLLVAGLLIFIFAVIEAYYMGILSAERVDALMNSPLGPPLEKFVAMTSSAIEKSKSILGR